MNLRTAFYPQGLTPAVSPGDRVSVWEAALFAYRFLLQKFWVATALLALPMASAGLVLYTCLHLYLSELLLFLQAPDPRVASFALGVLAAGIFLSLFCYAIAVVAVADLVLGKAPKRPWNAFKAQRREWRVYAAYMRFLLLLSMVFVSVYLLAAYVLPLFALPQNFVAPVLAVGSALVVFWLTARIGFLVPPVVFSSEGPVLRNAWQRSRHDTLRNIALLAMLLVPGLLVQVAGEYALQFGAWAPRLTGNLPFADYARIMGEMLGSFLIVVTLSSFVSVVLLTAGAMGLYRNELLVSKETRG